MPVWGRHISFLKIGQPVGRFHSGIGVKESWNGAFSQTCLANGQWSRVCSIVSRSPQWMQIGSSRICLDASLSPTGRAPFNAFQRNSLSFGAVFNAHISGFRAWIVSRCTGSVALMRGTFHSEV